MSSHRSDVEHLAQDTEVECTSCGRQFTVVMHKYANVLCPYCCDTVHIEASDLEVGFMEDFV